MANKVQKPCRICGKMFTPCADCENDKTIFHWRRVACSLDCAKKYFKKIEESRQFKVEKESIQKNDHDENLDSSKMTNTNILKPKRSRKNNIENKESEQID